MFYLLTTTFVDFPSASETIASSSEWSQVMFDSLKWPLYIAIGLMICLGIIMFIINLIRSIFSG